MNRDTQGLAPLDPEIGLDREYWLFAMIYEWPDEKRQHWTMSVCPIRDGQAFATGARFGDQESFASPPGEPPAGEMVLAALRLLKPGEPFDPAIFDDIESFSRWFKRYFPWGIRIRGESPIVWDWSTSEAVLDRRIRFGWPLVEPPADLLGGLQVEVIGA